MEHTEKTTSEVEGYAFVPVSTRNLKPRTPFAPAVVMVPEGFSNLHPVIQAGTLEEMGVLEPGTSAKMRA